MAAPASRLAIVLAGASFAACGGGAHASPALADRVEALEQRLAAANAQQERLITTLRDHGIVFHAEPPRDAAEATERALDDLDSALARLLSAVQSQDVGKGQNAKAALDAAIAALRRDPGSALPALMARAEVAAPLQQAELLGCYAQVGEAAAAAGLLAVAAATERPPGLRVAAARSLIAVDAKAGAPVVAAMLREPTPLPDLYLLLFQLAKTGIAEAAPVMVTALQQSSDRSVRCHAATGLGEYGTPESVDALAAAAIGDEYPAVRTNALRALVRVAPGERLRAVAEQVLANDAEASVRAVARELAPETSGR